VDDGNRQLERNVVGDGEPLQAPLVDEGLDHVARHVAPAEAREQKLQPRRQIREAPDVGTDHAALDVLRHRGAIGQHQLHMRFERFACDRRALAGERVVGGDDGDERDAGEELGAEVARRPGEQGVDRHARRALAQALFGAAERLGEQGRGQFRELAAQRVQAHHQQRHGEDRVDRQRQFRLDVLGHARGPSAHRLGAFEDRPRVLDDGEAGVGQNRGARRAVEQRDSQRRLHRLHGLADRRLHPAEPPRRRRKASGLGDRCENPHLVKRQGIEHPSPRLIGSAIFLPITMMEPDAHLLCAATFAKGNRQ
jgi:hypothetical protein